MTSFASGTAMPPIPGTTRSSVAWSASSAPPPWVTRVRERSDAERIRVFLRALGEAAEREGICYLTGGATAVLLGWRPTTLDVDIRLEPDQDEVLRAIPRLKDELQINVELAAPGDFIPLPAGWADRSIAAGREGRLVFRHFDLYSQALAKLERGHAQDLEDVATMFRHDLVEPTRLRACFDEIEPQLYRFPAIDPADFRRALEEAVP